ncbi:hypothetical protein PLICRDRAFT_55560 [Plicaturopsis crispa FD-325 SS-3]|nr:hypothetical protein PLICRDRAFT_55560 [Plicaturopsis crispa FD-325 SS-3]
MSTDAGYTILLTHLHRPSSNSLLPAIQSSLAHHLATVSTPARLAATALTSPFFRPPLTHARTLALCTAVRAATHLKHAEIFRRQKEQFINVFARSASAQIGEWAGEVLEGTVGALHVLRLAACGGLLQGLADKKIDHSVKSQVEDEVLVALAEVVDAYGSGSWEREFMPENQQGDIDALSSSLIISGDSLALIADTKLRALPLPRIAELTTTTLSNLFLTSLAITPPSNGMSPAAVQTLRDSVPLLSRLAARTLALSPPPAQISALETLEGVCRAAAEKMGWSITHPSTRSDEIKLDDTDRWTLLKTLLFSTVMIVDAVLSTAIFLPPQSYPSHSSSSNVSSPPTRLTLHTLYALNHLAPLISHFGGLSTASGGFTELKKTFYLALDVLAADPCASEEFVGRICSISSDATVVGVFKDSRQAHIAFALACVEQLIPVLSAGIVQGVILDFCLPYLNDCSHRETYESAHSVMLAIFAAHVSSTTMKAGFAKQLVPFYAGVLIENSIPERLSTTQLSLAFSALVRACCPAPASASPPALASYCIDLLSTAARDAPPEQKHRLHLAAAACVSAVPLALLPRVLDEVRTAVKGEADVARRTELVRTLWGEVKDRVGDAEREYVVRWWYEWRGELMDGLDLGAVEGKEDAVARL